jgi:aspartate-semialdehyde dehydrogenase
MPRLPVAILGATGAVGQKFVDLLDNVIPWIGGEEEKIAEETRKLLGTLEETVVRGAAGAAIQNAELLVASGYACAAAVIRLRPASFAM